MREHTFRVLEYFNLLDYLSRYASCPLGKDDCLSLRPLVEKSAIEKEHTLVNEMRLLQKVKGFFSFDGIAGVDSLITRAKVEGSYLEPVDILSIKRLLDSSKLAITKIKENSQICPGLNEMVSALRLCNEVSKEIGRCISAPGKIIDSASPELKSIRRKKLSLRNHITRRLEEILLRLGGKSKRDDNLISLRDGRYVISIRSDVKSILKGIIHDYSHTKSRCFFEPMEVIEINNELARLSHQEREEEIRVLKSLTSLISEYGEDIKTHQRLISKLDGLRARALFGEKIKGIRPLFNEEKRISLIGARHPVLTLMADKGSPPVPLDIRFGGDKRLMIISGPNRGGKTVTLKTIGLISLMAQAGIPVPAEEGSSLCIFQDIMAEIGDEQNLMIGLSTFSAHMMNLQEMIERANSESLIIIDEPGFGTDPEEGASLAMAVLDELIERGGLIAVSTHFNRIRSYGILKKGVVNVSMGFDDRTKRPTFSLRYGATGTSYAYEIAEECGIDAKIIQRARNYIDKDEVRLNSLIEKLNKIIEDTETERERLTKNKKKYISAVKRASKKIIFLERRKKEELGELRSRYTEIIAKAKQEIGVLINEFKKRGPSAMEHIRERYRELEKQMERMAPVSEKKDKQIFRNFSKGQVVRHRLTGKTGEIVLLDKGHSKAVLSAGNVKLMVPLDEIEPCNQEYKGHHEERSECINLMTTHGVKERELNVVGLRAEDAIRRIEKAIDMAIIDGTSRIRIVHGHGTGRLRKAIREYLKGVSCVKGYSGEDFLSGGDAITIVELE